MANLTKEQVKTIIDNAPAGSDPRKIVEGLVQRGHTLEGLDTSKVASTIRVNEATQDNQFQEPQKKGFLEKARDFAVGVIGGGKLAEGAGMAIAAPGIQQQQEQARQQQSQVNEALIRRIREKQAKGEDTSRLKKALEMSIESGKISADVSQDFVDALPSDKQVIGSAIRLGATFASPVIGRGVASVVGAPAAGILSGAAQGAKIGAATGVIEGAIQGGGIAAEQDASAEGIAGAALGGAVTGGLAGGALGGVIGGVSGKVRANAAIKAEREALLKSRPDSRVAAYTLTGKGQVAKDPVAVEAIKQGVDEGTVATIKGASVADKRKAQTMLDIIEQGKTDPKYKALNRPSDVIGQSVLDRFKVVQSANSSAGAQLETVAKGLAGKKANPVPAFQSFASDLDDMGISYKGGKLNYEGSVLEGVSGPQKVLDNVVNRLRGIIDDGYDLHKLKKFLDENLEYGSAGEGLSGKAEGVLKNLRRNIDQILDTTFDDYNAVNTTYSETRDALDDLLQAGGTRFKPTDAGADKKIGTLARRILSNAGSRVDVLNTLQKLQDIAEKYGGKFDDDIVTQTVFVNDLERLFGTSAPTSLAGEVTKGVSQARGVVGKLKGVEGITDLALQLGAEGIEKARGINEEGLLKALRELVKS